MVRQFAIAALGAVALAGCAGDSSTRVLGYQGTAAALVPAATAATAPIAEPKMKKSMASRVLAARALERVTGRKADPARLASLE
jgi:hypothetical protein